MYQTSNLAGTSALGTVEPTTPEEFGDLTGGSDIVLTPRSHPRPAARRSLPA